jgi:ParB/Sulfiredoxin domain
MNVPAVEKIGTVFDIAGPGAVSLDRLPLVTVPIRALRLSDTPRQGVVREDHCKILAESLDFLPPILVHSPSMRVIDGIHRVRAAVLNDRGDIEARMFEGPDQDAFVLAVRLNILHGLPLSRAERHAAAARILLSHPHWSNRMLASVSGLSAGTIAGIRDRSTAQIDESNSRMGKDGRIRPLDGTAGRQRVCELLESHPAASIRTIARMAGVSPSTVHDVRRRLSEGHEPVPLRLRDRQQRRDSEPMADGRIEQLRSLLEVGADTCADPETILRKLTRDPTFRYSDSGHRLLRWLDASRQVIAHCPQAAGHVPPHTAGVVAALAREYAYAWAEFAARLLELQAEAC